MKNGERIYELISSSLLYYDNVLKVVNELSADGIRPFMFFVSMLKVAELQTIQAVAMNAPNASGTNLTNHRERVELMFVIFNMI